MTSVAWHRRAIRATLDPQTNVLQLCVRQLFMKYRWIAALLITTLISATTAASAAPRKVQAEFPLELLDTPITTGTATVAWTTQPDGRISDAVVLDASHPAFGDAALQAVPKRLPPTAQTDLPRFEKIDLIFKRKQAIVHEGSYARFQREERERIKGRQIRTVDADNFAERILLAQTPPRVCIDGHDLEGGATVRYLIDRAGKVRIPRVLEATSSTFARLVLDAVKQWEFEPLILDGQLVQVEDTQAFAIPPTRGCINFRPDIGTHAQTSIAKL